MIPGEMFYDTLKSISGLNVLMNTNNIFHGFLLASEVSTTWITFIEISDVLDTTKERKTVKESLLYQVDIYSNSLEKADKIKKLIIDDLQGRIINGWNFYIESARSYDEENNKKYRKSIDIAIEIN